MKQNVQRASGHKISLLQQVRLEPLARGRVLESVPGYLVATEVEVFQRSNPLRNCNDTLIYLITMMG